MGCDIHVVVEQRRGERSPWHLVAVPPMTRRDIEERNYITFGVLAGVREPDVPPISEPRGFPDDAEVETSYHPHYTNVLEDAKLHGRFLGDHSHSWLTLAELDAFDWDQLYNGRYAMDNGTSLREATGVERWLPWLRTVNPDPHNVRLVFGFDS